MNPSILLLTALLSCPLPGFPPLLAVDQDPPEIGTPALDTDNPEAPPPLNSVNLEMDFGLAYTGFTGPDMESTYTGLPQLNLGLSVAIGPIVRAFLTTGYGSVSGDPYYDLAPGAGDDALTLHSVPVVMGLKTNVAHSTRVRFWFSAAWMLTWVKEVNHPHDSAATGITSGYILSMGPEILLGNRQRIGLDLGWGGTRGNLGTDLGHRHNVDLVGYQGRLYYAFAWKGDSP